MNHKIIGRKGELEALNEAYASGSPELIALYGRRRIGKTFLIRQHFGDRICIEITGLQNGDTQQQLINFQLAISRYFPNYESKSGKLPRKWLEAFFQLSQVLESELPNQRKVIFLDEIPWMGNGKTEFITALGWFWNSWASKENIVLVICGSAASWMIKKVINDRGGLHNRVTRLIQLKPFSLTETKAFCESKKINLSPFQILQIYMAIGGVPMYLNQLKSGLSAVQNIQLLCFDRQGYLRDEFDRLFASLFFKHERHVEIVKILAENRLGLNRETIIKKSSFTNGGGLTSVLTELEESSFISAYANYGKKKKGILYRLTDFYTQFYLSFISKHKLKELSNFGQLSDLPTYHAWSGYTFENVCLTHLDQIRKALGISVIYSEASAFFVRKSDELPGAQIDLVIDRRDQTINLCEAKFSSEPFRTNKKFEEKMQQYKAIFRANTKTKKQLFITLISPYGLAQNINSTDAVDQVISMDDLFM
ncbi:MAG: ATP-binding protein [Bacteroidota bacterium]